MSNQLETCLSFVKKLCKAEDASLSEVIQELWSGYGQLMRVSLKKTNCSSVIVKYIDWNAASLHPRGWNTDVGHQRKLRSYQVESYWYQKWKDGGDELCYLPKCYGFQQARNSITIVLEDLQEHDFSNVKSSVDWEEVKVVLKWLAYFHAKHLGRVPEGLWEEGTYWHLATRPQELKALSDARLKESAAVIDAALRNAPYPTIVHGDAKLANFCFSDNGQEVAAVDFQYVGGGCGMKDVAYFVGSCMSEKQCEAKEEAILDHYFTHLAKAVAHYQKQVDISGVVRAWRPLYRVAWADFHRFLKGWSPTHWKINTYSERVVSEVINEWLPCNS